MRAIIQGQYGPPDNVLQLEDVDKPVADHYEQLVRVNARASPSVTGSRWEAGHRSRIRDR